MKQSIMGYITALINVHKGSIKPYTNPAVRECEYKFLGELTNLLRFIDRTSGEAKDHITIVLNGENYENKIYKQVLEKVLINLRLIDSPNPGDEYIDNSIEIIAKALKEEM